jgi:hypothetical protein
MPSRTHKQPLSLSYGNVGSSVLEAAPTLSKSLHNVHPALKLPIALETLIEKGGLVMDLVIMDFFGMAATRSIEQLTRPDTTPRDKWILFFENARTEVFSTGIILAGSGFLGLGMNNLSKAVPALNPKGLDPSKKWVTYSLAKTFSEHARAVLNEAQGQKLSPNELRTRFMSRVVNDLEKTDDYLVKEGLQGIFSTLTDSLNLKKTELQQALQSALIDQVDEHGVVTKEASGVAEARQALERQLLDPATSSEVLDETALKANIGSRIRLGSNTHGVGWDRKYSLKLVFEQLQTFMKDGFEEALKESTTEGHVNKLQFAKKLFGAGEYGNFMDIQRILPKSTDSYLEYLVKSKVWQTKIPLAGAMMLGASFPVLNNQITKWLFGVNYFGAEGALAGEGLDTSKDKPFPKTAGQAQGTTPRSTVPAFSSADPVKPLSSSLPTLAIAPPLTFTPAGGMG